jgi:hypothetical protein
LKPETEPETEPETAETAETDGNWTETGHP